MCSTCPGRNELLLLLLSFPYVLIFLLSPSLSPSLSTSLSFLSLCHSHCPCVRYSMCSPLNSSGGKYQGRSGNLISCSPLRCKSCLSDFFSSSNPHQFLPLIVWLSFLLIFCLSLCVSLSFCRCNLSLSTCLFPTIVILNSFPHFSFSLSSPLSFFSF